MTYPEPDFVIEQDTAAPYLALCAVAFILSALVTGVVIVGIGWAWARVFEAEQESLAAHRAGGGR